MVDVFDRAGSDRCAGGGIVAGNVVVAGTSALALAGAGVNQLTHEPEGTTTQ